MTRPRESTTHLRGFLVTALCATALSIGCEDPTALTGADGSGGNENTPTTPTSTKAPGSNQLSGGIVTGSANPTAAPGATSSVNPGTGSSSAPASASASPTVAPTETPTPTPVDTRRSIDVLMVDVATPAIYVAPPAGREGAKLYPYTTIATISAAVLSDGSTYRGPFQYSVNPSGIVTITPRLDQGADIRALSYGNDQIKDVVVTVLASNAATLSNSRSATCSLRILPVSGAIVTVK